MIDIVEWLRREAELVALPRLAEAASEIERLRADKAAISETASFYLHEITRLKAGNHEDR